MAVIPSTTPNKPKLESVSEMGSVNNTNDEEMKDEKNENENLELVVSGSKGKEMKVEKNENEKLSVSGPKRSRNKDPGVRIVGKRIYDPKNGSTCHQCRQKTTDVAVKCKNIRGNNKPCPLKFCQPCLANRYGQKAEVVLELENWTCPKCSGNCNCSLCLKKQGLEPTGILIHTAKANGYSSVSEMLQTAGHIVLNSEKSSKVDGSSPKKRAASKMAESSSSGKRELVNVETDVGRASLCQGSNLVQLQISEGQKRLPDTKDSKPSRGEGSKEEQDDAINDATLDMIMPVGAELTTVGGIEMPPEDVGKALQFLEFCTVFGEIIEVKKGQPECILKDLLDGRSSRPGRLSLTTQFHIRLISLIQEDRGKGSSDLSPAQGKDSWVLALKECISGLDSGAKLQLLEHLDKGADGYENLSSSDKLMILNILCDEVLGTSRIRSWIDDQNSEHAEKAKEQKGRIHSAKDKEKLLKQKVQDEVAKAIKEDSATLSIPEHKALISQLKLEAAQAHTEMLESTIVFKNRNQTSEALRSESIHSDSNGHVYWRLKCTSDSSQILVQYVGTDDTTAQEKWFSLDDEQKEVVENYMQQLKGKKRRRMEKVIPVQPCRDDVDCLGN